MLAHARRFDWQRIERTTVRQRNLGAMLEKRWATPSKRKPKLQSNERKACDAVILRLEEREGASRERRICLANFPGGNWLQS